MNNRQESSRSPGRWLWLAGAVLALGCGPKPTSQAPASPSEAAAPAQSAMHGPHAHGGGMGMHGPDAMAMHGHDGMQCPMAVPGTSVRAEEVSGGAAMTFTTTGDLAEVRRRVAQKAAKHAEGSGCPDCAMMSAKTQQCGGAGGCAMPPVDAKAEDVEGGARLVLLAKNPQDVDALRAHVRSHAEMMAAGKCPMMHAAGGPPPP